MSKADFSGATTAGTSGAESATTSTATTATAATADPDYVAEQTGIIVHAAVSDEPLESLVAAARQATMTPAMGAVVTFEGIVRDHDGGARVDALHYTAHPSATEAIAQIVDDVVREHPQVRAWAQHRIGSLGIGDMAFLVIVAAAHRGPAFAAASEIADRVKAGVPIWKEQDMTDGSTVWVGM